MKCSIGQLRVAAAATLALAQSCAIPETQVGETYTTIQVSNPLSMVRNDEVVEIPLSEVRARFRKFDANDFSVHLLPAVWYPDRGDALLATDPAPMVPAQVIDRDFDGTPDTLLVICDFKAGEKRFLAVASPRFSSLAPTTGPRVGGGLFMRSSVERGADAIKSGGSYARVDAAVLDPQHSKGDGLYQCDGPLFETEHSAWRFLLDSRLCLDVVGKRDSEMHFDPRDKAFAADFLDLSRQPWGGSLLGDVSGFGAGAFGYAEGGTLVPMSGVDSVQYRKLGSGSAATQIEVRLFGAKLGRGSCDLVWRMTHYAGGRIMRHDVSVSRSDHGLAFAMNADGERSEEPTGRKSWMRVGSFGTSNVGGPAGGALGLGILANGRTATGFVKNPADVIGVAFDNLFRTMTFYTVAAWDQEPGGLRDAQDFRAELDRLADRLDNPIKITNLNKTLGN